jgi:hypothetical protein
MLNALGIHLLRNAVKELIDVPFRKHDNRGGIEEAEETGCEKADSVIERKDTEDYW